MSVTFRNLMPKPINTLTHKLKKGEYVYGPTCKVPIIVTEASRGSYYGVRLDNGNTVPLDQASYEVLELEIIFQPSTEG